VAPMTTAEMPAPFAVPAVSSLQLGRPAEILAAGLPHLRGAGRRAILKSLLLACGPLLEVERADRLTRVAEPAIFALNHANYAEALLAPAALVYLRRGRAVHFLADWMFLELPLLGPLLRLGEPIPVFGKRARFGWGEARRHAGRREPALDRCLARLAGGASLGLFPEGRRNRGPRRLLVPRPGLGELALRAGVPVVPIGIRYPAAARLGRAPHLGRTVLAVGEPVDLAAERERFAAVAGDPAARAARRALARRAAARVMAALGELSDRGGRGLHDASARGDRTHPARPPADRAHGEEASDGEACRDGAAGRVV
jgi:1-acyl-sn-glycerol-3-phosphate acyltransferase